MLTPEPARRARRLLAAARAKRDAGALDAALELLAAAEAGPVDALQAAEIEELRGEIAFDQRRIGEAARLLVGAARRFEPLDAGLARAHASRRRSAQAMWAGPERRCGRRPRPRAPRRPRPSRPSAVDVLLDALGDPGHRRLRRGGARRSGARWRRSCALEAAADVGRWLWLTGARAGAVAALELWDADAWHALAERQVQVARDMGALVRLQFALHFLVGSHMLAGDLAAAARPIEEERGDRRGDRQTRRSPTPR